MAYVDAMTVRAHQVLPTVGVTLYLATALVVTALISAGANTTCEVVAPVPAQ